MIDYPIIGEAQSARALIVALAYSYGMRVAPAGTSTQTTDVRLQPSTTGARLATAKAWIQARQWRDKLLDSDLFADPAWDMLLDLYEKHCEGIAVTVTCACLAARAPSATAFRQLSRLCSKGLIDRHDDGADRRRVHVVLTPRAVEALDAIMDAALTTGRRLTIDDVASG